MCSSCAPTSKGGSDQYPDRPSKLPVPPEMDPFNPASQEKT
jgi:flagellar biosynthetic protein FlhB